MRCLKIIDVVVVLFLLPNISWAAWKGPIEVVVATWGKGQGQVGYESGDSGDTFPWRGMAISPTGRIAICDEVNDRVAIFSPDGRFERNINILSTRVVFDRNDNLYLKAKFRKFDLNGKMLFEKNVGFDDLYITPNDELVGYEREMNRYSIYSTSGDLQKTSTGRPPESILLRKDSSIQIKGSIIKKLDTHGNIIGDLTIPRVVGEIGDPIVAPNGDIYTWKIERDKYLIIKWVWETELSTSNKKPDLQKINK